MVLLTVITLLILVGVGLFLFVMWAILLVGTLFDRQEFRDHRRELQISWAILTFVLSLNANLILRVWQWQKAISL